MAAPECGSERRDLAVSRCSAIPLLCVGAGEGNEPALLAKQRRTPLFVKFIAHRGLVGHLAGTRARTVRRVRRNSLTLLSLRAITRSSCATRR